MKKQYTREQITEAIQYWEFVLKRMDESKSILLDALFNTFGTDSMLKPFMGEITDSVLRKCFDVLNVNFFSSKLKAIPLMYVSDSEARRFLASRDVKEDEIPNMFFGVHSVLYDNDPIKLKWNDTLILHDDVILLNKKTYRRKIDFIFNGMFMP